MCSKGCIIGLILLIIILKKSVDDFDEILIGEESGKVFEMKA